MFSYGNFLTLTQGITQVNDVRNINSKHPTGDFQQNLAIAGIADLAIFIHRATGRSVSPYATVALLAVRVLLVRDLIVCKKHKSFTDKTTISQIALILGMVAASVFTLFEKPNHARFAENAFGTFQLVNQVLG